MRDIHRSATTWLARRTERGSTARPPHRSHRRRLTLEPLEGRALLSLTTWTVNSLGDTGTGSGTSGDLRYVITQADQTTGDNTINFAVIGTITLYSALPDLSNTTGVMDIEGPGASSLTVARSSALGTPDFGIFTVDANVQAQLAGLTITGGLDGSGGGIDNDGALTVSNSTIANNSATDSYGGPGIGGGIYNAATLIGGRIYNAGTLTISNSTIANNSSFSNGVIDFGGGGIFTFGTLTVSNSTIENNSARGTYGSGGGIDDNAGTLTVSNSTIANNSTGGAGGGIFTWFGSGTGALTVSNSTIANNSATGGLGGGMSINEGTATVTNSTIANNSDVGGFGGGIDGSITGVNDTIAYNTATYGGGGLWGDFTLNNSLIALNTSGTGTPDDISGTVSSASAYNLIGTGGSGGLVNGTNGNQVGVADPGLDPNGLQNNGGPTQTIALVTGSPAIDAGSNALAVNPTTGQPLTTDQRGALRGPAGLNAGTTVDIGAYEASSSYLVTSTADTTDVGTLRAAVGWANVSTNANPANVASPAPNTVIFDTAGTFATPQTITLTQGTLELSNTATPESIAGTGVANLTVARSSAAGTPDFGIFTVDSGADVKLVGLTITGGLSDFAGGGVDNAGTLTVIDSSVIDNGVQGVQGVFVGGGGIYNAGKLTVANSNIANNTASPSAYVTAFVGGGGIFNDGTATVTDSTIMGNRTGSDGGGILNEGTLTVTNSTIAQNYAGLLGVGNFTPDPGGGIFSDGTMTVASSTIANNGSAISNASTGGNATVTNSTMVYNGDGIDNSYGGTVTVTDSTITNSQVGLNNGGGLVSGGTLTVTNCTIANNNTGISNDGTATVTNSAIMSNLNSGINNEGTLTVTNSTIADNTAAISAGGIGNEGTLTVTNSTIADNTAANSAGGIGNVGKLTVTNSTIAYNEADFGGGLAVIEGTATLYNTIVALNTGSGNGAPADDISVFDSFGTVSSASAYNLIGTGGSGGLTNGVNGNQVGVADPGLDPRGLQNNGGPTQTIALVTGSPAIGAGSIALAVDPTTGQPLTTDQRGFPRIVNGTVDIGAYEVQSYITAVAVGWGTQTAALQTAADGLRLLPAGRNTDLPWLGIDQVQITLTQPATLAAGDISVIGSSGTNYGPVTVTGSGTSYTITLAQPINAADRVTITIGNALIAPFTRRLDVLPGDVNDDGVVNVQDMVAIRNQMLGFLGAVPTIFGDINGDGTVDINDYTAVLELIGTTLPSIT